MEPVLFANEAVIGVDCVCTRCAYYIIIWKVVCFRAENKLYSVVSDVASLHLPGQAVVTSVERLF